MVKPTSLRLIHVSHQISDCKDIYMYVYIYIYIYIYMYIYIYKFLENYQLNTIKKIKKNYKKKLVKDIRIFLMNQQ